MEPNYNPLGLRYLSIRDIEDLARPLLFSSTEKFIIGLPS